MAMKPSSKFERMNAAKLEKAPAKGPASMPRIGTTGGVASGNAIRDRRKSAQRASSIVLLNKLRPAMGQTGDQTQALADKAAKARRGALAAAANLKKLKK